MKIYVQSMDTAKYQLLRNKRFTYINGNMPECRYYNTSYGCKYGLDCIYKHVS